jgi:carbamoyl-phosphate synthase large subunit
VPVAAKLAALGFRIMSTGGTGSFLQEHGIEFTLVRKIHEGRPNLLDHLANGAIAMVVNTPSGKGARTDEGRIRAAAVSHGVPCITTINGAKAAVAALERLRLEPLEVYAIQDLLQR